MKKISILLVGLLFYGLAFVHAQGGDVSGTVTSSEDGMPLPGVSVIVTGTTTGVTTNIDGKYTLSVPADASTLTFSFVGMATKVVSIDGQSVLDVMLDPDIVGLDEVIVTAYGTTKKASFTGSATTINVDQMQDRQITSVTSLLQGNSSGVQVLSSTGQPGTNPSVRIRGIGSINASSSPLYVVDGVPYDGNVSLLQGADIETFTVLKDANSTALYGSRGANGVIIITTKKGVPGKPRANFKASWGVSSKAVEDYKTVGAKDYYELTWEAIRNGYVQEGATEAQAAQDASDDVTAYLVYNPFNDASPIGLDGKLKSGVQQLWETKWMDEILRTGKREEYQFDVSGGDDNTTYFLSGSYLNNEGIVPLSDFERFTARLNLDQKVNTWLKVGMNLSGATSDQNYPNTEGSSYSNMIQFGRNVAPIYPVYMRDANGDFILDDNENKIYDYGEEGDQDGRSARPTDGYPNTNVIGNAELDEDIYERDNFSMRSYIELDIIEGLKFKTNFSLDYYIYNHHQYNNPDFGFAKSYGGISDKYRHRTFSYTFNNLLSYDRNFGQSHINLLAGHEAYNYHYDYLYASKSAFPFSGLDELDAGAAIQAASSYEHNYRIEGYLTRIEYDFADKYYISASYRKDGSSRFSKDVRWGDFWSVGGSWRLGEENFIDLPWLSNLKLKASYGTLGNDALLGDDKDGDGFLDPVYYAYQGLFEAGHDNLTDPGLLVSRLATPNLTWETSKTTNVGVELGLFNRVSLEVEFFNKAVEDMLFNRPLAISTGVDGVDENIGDMKNVGLEVNLNATPVITRGFRWDIDFNFTQVKNEITKLPQEEIISGSKKYMKGHSVYDFYIEEYAGVNPENGNSLWYTDIYEEDAEGNIVYDDNNDPIVIGRETTEAYSSADRYYVGSSLPDFYGGITNTLKYKGFDFSVFFYFSYGGKILDYDYQQLSHTGERYGGNFSVDMLDRWTPENTNTDIPKLNVYSDNGNGRSTRFLYDASYARLRNLTIGYSLPASVISQLKISQVRVFLSGDNLLTFYKHEGLDPEVNFAGTTDNRYPQLKTYSFGVNVSF